MILLGGKPAAVIQGQLVLHGNNQEVMKKINIMESMFPNVFVERSTRQC